MGELEFSVGAGGASHLDDNDQWIIGVDPGVSDALGYAFVNQSDTGFYMADAGQISFSTNDTCVDDVYNLFFSGKTIKEHSDEYLKIISWLPGVHNDQLDAVSKLEFFRKQMFPEPDEK